MTGQHPTEDVDVSMVRLGRLLSRYDAAVGSESLPLRVGGGAPPFAAALADLWNLRVVLEELDRLRTAATTEQVDTMGHPIIKVEELAARIVVGLKDRLPIVTCAHLEADEVHLVNIEALNRAVAEGLVSISWTPRAEALFEMVRKAGHHA